MLNRHIEELKAGRAVVAIETDSGKVDRVAEVASTNGVRFIVHFGALAVTWLKNDSRIHQHVVVSQLLEAPAG